MLQKLEKEITKRNHPQNLQDEDKHLFVREFVKEIKSKPNIFLKNIKITPWGGVYQNTKIVKNFYSTSPNIFIRVKNQILGWVSIPLNEDDKNGYIVTNSNAENFFHWHLDVLQKLEYVTNDNKAKVYIPHKYDKSFYTETLKLYPEIEFIKIKSTTKITNAVYVNDIAQTGNYRPELLKKLSQRLNKIQLENRGCDNYSTEKENIYISRASARNRKIVNEYDLHDTFRRRKTKIVMMENLNYKEQISLVKNTEVLIGIHGAGLTHMIYMPKNSSVIELRSEDDDKNNCYYSLATELGHKYYYIKVKPLGLKKATQKKNYKIEKESIAKLEEILDIISKK